MKKVLIAALLLVAGAAFGDECSDDWQSGIERLTRFSEYTETDDLEGWENKISVLDGIILYDSPEEGERYVYPIDDVSVITCALFLLPEYDGGAPLFILLGDEGELAAGLLYVYEATK